MAGTEGGSREVSDKYTERDDLPVDNPGSNPMLSVTPTLIQRPETALTDRY